MRPSRAVPRVDGAPKTVVGEPGRVELRDQAQEEGRCRLVLDATPGVGLLRARDGLAPRGHDAASDPGIEGLAQPVERVGDRGDAGRDRLPVVVGGARHEIEAEAYLRHRAADDAERAQLLVGLGELHADLEVARERLGRDPLRVVTRMLVRELVQRRACVVQTLRDPVGRVVGELGIVPGDPLEGRSDRVERGRPNHEPIGERGDRAGAFGRSHPLTHRARSSGSVIGLNPRWSTGRRDGTVGLGGRHTAAADQALARGGRPTGRSATDRDRRARSRR